jgi:lipopolysaccharide transport system permease protein
MVALVDFLIVLALFAGLCAWWRFVPDIRVLFLPVFALLAMLTALGAGLWLTALTVKFRDFRYIAPFLLQVGLFLSPVGFSSSNLPTWRPLFSLNPMVGVIDGFRWCLLRGHPPLYQEGLVSSTVMALLLVASGLWYFRRMERTFADSI